jgi:hypothetical protein
METFATALCEVDTLLPFPQVSARFMKMGILSRQVANEHPHDSAEHAKHSRFASTCVWLAQSLRAGGTKAEQAAAFIKSVMPSASYPAPTTSAAAPPRTPVPPVTVASSPEDRAGAEWDEYQQRHGRDRAGMNRANYVTWRVAQMSGKPITPIQATVASTSTSSTTTTYSDQKAEFNQRVSALAATMPNDKAVAKVVADYPHLHAAYLAAMQPAPRK